MVRSAAGLWIFCICVHLGAAELHYELKNINLRHIICVLLLSTRAVFGGLWGQRRCVPRPCPSCRGRWRTSVLCCAVWLLKVWPGWSRWSETPASPSPSPCSASTGRKSHLDGNVFLFTVIFIFMRFILYLCEAEFCKLISLILKWKQIRSKIFITQTKNSSN